MDEDADTEGDGEAEGDELVDELLDQPAGKVTEMGDKDMEQNGRRRDGQAGDVDGKFMVAVDAGGSKTKRSAHAMKVEE